MVAPWVPFWEHNRFAQASPMLQAIMMSPYARGGVTGVGIITALAGLAELGSLIISRVRGHDSSPEPLDDARRPEQTP